ncbi:hypothetical protein Sjap_013437 [Stephania japonica]|uniref:Cucumisin n=1 Tax=Stephania japonica TaxID=461633 RepID=A0AAP0NZV8_9MAGN
MAPTLPELHHWRDGNVPRCFFESKGKYHSLYIVHIIIEQAYIVYMGERASGEFSASAVHTDMLQQVVGSNIGASDVMLHSYKRSFNGFAAMLTEKEVEAIKAPKSHIRLHAGLEIDAFAQYFDVHTSHIFSSDVVSVFPSQKKHLHTTRSWDFIGFPLKAHRSTVESDIIIGMLDSGIWPESASFSDKGYGPPPSKWRGICQSSSNFTCNNKIIGARYYHGAGPITPSDIPSPRDSEGHGTHTASTAAGREVSGVSLLGLKSGTARGGVPSARIAVYKVCWSDGCDDADVLAAFDDAIADGVDIISLSVGGSFPLYYFTDSIAIGAFHAMKKGVLTSNSAGNEGPRPYSASNISPWSLTVAASNTNIKFATSVKLGNGKVYEVMRYMCSFFHHELVLPVYIENSILATILGASINTFTLGNTMYPMIYGGDAPNTKKGYNSSESRFCDEETLNEELVKGKIVLCDSTNSGTASLHAGAVGIVMVQQKEGVIDTAFSFPLPATYIRLDDGAEVFKYMNTTSKPTATIFRTVEEKQRAPFVVSFSSRGPSGTTPDILKPDLTAPGSTILAAWSGATSVTGIEDDKRVVPYNIISGTSMSCPHATAVAAYVKSFRPTWSPAALKSALMTTANPMSRFANPDAELAYGAGHINPVKAINPGLVYDAGAEDYVRMLCGQGYNTTTLRIVTGDISTCSESNNGTVWDLNYPSFALSVADNTSSFTKSFHRTVTNVGSPDSVYRAIVIAPRWLKIQVIPRVLSFKALGQMQSFVVTVRGRNVSRMISAALVWSDGAHQVRSPILVYHPPQTQF